MGAIVFTGAISHNAARLVELRRVSATAALLRAASRARGAGVLEAVLPAEELERTLDALPPSACWGPEGS